MAKRRRLSPARPDVFPPQEAGDQTTAAVPSSGTAPDTGAASPALGQPLGQPLGAPRPARVVRYPGAVRRAGGSVPPAPVAPAPPPEGSGR